MNRVFILGAGFSHHVSGGIFPLMRELGWELKERYPWVSSYLTNKSSEVNVEKVLTFLDLESSDYENIERNKNLEHISDIKKFIKEKLDIDKIKKSQIEKAENLCSKLFTEEDTIITFNYDCLLEHILWKLNFWSPNGGYGNSLNLNNLSVYGSQVEKNQKNIIILKPHSSLNFELEENYLKPWISNKLFPNINANWEREPQEPPIVLPSFVKVFGENRTLMYIWHEAIKMIRKADNVIIIGYSFPKADAMIRVLFSFICADEFKNNVDKIKIVILNKGVDAEFVQRQIQEVGRFGENDIEYHLLNKGDDKDYYQLCLWLEKKCPKSDATL